MKHILLAFIAIFFVACGQNNNKPYYIYDGDTFEADDTVYRIAEIDAPEKDQVFGEQSKAYLSSLILNKEIKIIPIKTDSYGRTIAKIYVDDKNVAELMVETGNAWFYEYFSDNNKLRQLQSKARQNKRGLWAYPAINPYEFRKINQY